MVNTFQTSGQTVQSLDKEKKIPNGPNNEFCTSIDKVGSKAVSPHLASAFLGKVCENNQNIQNLGKKFESE